VHLRDAPETARPHARTTRQVAQRPGVRDEHVTRVGALEQGADREIGWHARGQVLGAVNREVDHLQAQRFLDRVDEHSTST
jgi:hypothetical protein